MVPMRSTGRSKQYWVRCTAGSMILSRSPVPLVSWSTYQICRRRQVRVLLLLTWFQQYFRHIMHTRYDYWDSECHNPLYACSWSISYSNQRQRAISLIENELHNYIWTRIRRLKLFPTELYRMTNKKETKALHPCTNIGQSYFTFLDIRTADVYVLALSKLKSVVFILS